MKTVIKLLPFALAASAIFTSCGGKQDPPTPPLPIDTITIKDFNVLFAPDLSNRIDAALYPKPVHDTVLLNGALDKVRYFCSLNNRKTGQQDIYKFDFVNKGILSQQAFQLEEMEIDLRQFKNETVKRSNYFRHNLRPDTEKFKKNVGLLYTYASAHPSGADVWNYFNESIHTSLLHIPQEEVLRTTDKIVFKTNKNVAVLLTDGYIESANKEQGYLVNGETINKIRKDYKSSGAQDLKQFIYANAAYGINKTSRPLTGLNVLVCEVLDRSLDSNGAATVQPTDFQILEILWTKWLTDSGCEKVQIVQAAKTPVEFTNTLGKFLEAL